MVAGSTLFYIAGVVALLWFLREGDSSTLSKLIVAAAYAGSLVMMSSGPGSRTPRLVIFIVVTLGLVVALFWDRPLSR